MLISRDRRFIFIHVPKTGGTSITASLLPFACGSTQLKVGRILGRKITRVLTKYGIAHLNPQPFQAHISAIEMIDKIGPAAFSSFFTFAFVRNPWDWQISVYEHARTLPPREPIARHLQSFDSYIRWRCDGNAACQTEYFCADNGRTLVDFVGRFEDLTKDFALVAERIGVPPMLPKLNYSRRRPFQHYYTDATREMVAACFAPDIERFGYVFEQCTSAAAA